MTPFAITDGQVLPEATGASAYSHQFSAPNCGANCAWTVYSGSLPSGLTAHRRRFAVRNTKLGNRV